MDEKEFFGIYIPALELALSNDNVIHDFSILTPDWYIEDENKRKEVYLFEELNYDEYKSLFEKVALYFDAKSHGFDKINEILIEKFKKNLQEEIFQYKKKYMESCNWKN